LYRRPVSERSGPVTGTRTTVADVPSQHRYEITADGRTVGFAAYVDRPGSEGGGQRRVFTHTEIDPEHEGEGLGSTLVAAALADVRASGRRVVPVCPFVTAYVKRHHEYDELVDRPTPAILSSL
jgi:predicted GNAT family acetyltransferase